MTLSSLPNKQLLFIENFHEKVDYPERSQEHFFEIYWVQQAPEPPFGTHMTATVKGQWVYLIAPFKGKPLSLEGISGVFYRFHKGLLNLELEDFSLEVLRLFQPSEDFTSLFVPEEELDTLEDLTRVMRRELNKDPRDFLFLKNLLKSFLLKLVSLKEEHYQLPDLNAKRVYHFLMLVESHYKETRNTNFYSGKLNLSAKRLNQILKERMGRTISELLQERVIMEAKRQLYEGKYSIKEIAIDLGFADRSYFSRFFKKMTGKSPEGFREELQSRM